MTIESKIENEQTDLLSILEKAADSIYSKQISEIISILKEIQSYDVDSYGEISESDFLRSLNASQFDFFSKFFNRSKNTKLMLKAQKLYIELLQKVIEDDEIISIQMNIINNKYHEVDVSIVSQEKLMQKEKDDRSKKARFAALKKHEPKNKAKNQIREIWASGKYSSKDICAEQECASLGLSFSTARKALINH